ncbi:MAG: glycosyltransferase family 4 protein [Tannerellaceae bacterium]|jgi:glycosyltransferase involved in cell wall biosynthesis|nr:glycosyltransferase family 4 protein [Tannerellaceae bacterium]
MKILFIHSLYAPHIIGGAENSLRILVESMSHRGHDVVVLATSDKKGLHEETVNGITVYRAGIKNKYWIYGNHSRSKINKIIRHTRDLYNNGMQVYVTEVIRKERPDIVSCHNLPGWSIRVWDSIRKENIPIVQVLHDYYFLCVRSSLFKKGRPCRGRCLRCKIMRLLYRKKSQQVDAVVGICSGVLNKVITAGFFPNSLKVVVHNVRVIPDVENKKIKRDKITFGFIGAISPHKGIQWLIEQFKKIESDHVLLRIAGKGSVSYENKMKTLASDDIRITFLGFSKPKDFYASIDVLIVPSTWEEPLGMVAIEACAYHVPVITSATGGLKEIIKDGINGLYCEVSDPDSLFFAMNKMINDRELFNKLHLNARESVKSFLDIDRLVSEYENVYRHILKCPSLRQNVSCEKILQP